ncbi:MAG: GNAT family N-acetyltransferase [Hasllibacter sp.]
MSVRLRPFHVDDAWTTRRIMHDAIRFGTAPHYDNAQRVAWAGPSQPPAGWNDRLADHVTLIADDVTAEADVPVGFGTMRRDGYLDLLFVRPEAMRRGIGGTLLDALEEGVADARPPRFTTRASVVLRPLLEARGWHVTGEATQIRDGVALPAFDMQWVVIPEAAA